MNRYIDLVFLELLDVIMDDGMLQRWIQFMNGHVELFLSTCQAMTGPV